MTHRIQEIKRRLSVLESRLNIDDNPSRGESLKSEFDRRLQAINNKIKNIASQEKQITKLQLDSILDTLSEYESALGITGNKNPDAPQTKPIRESPYKSNFKNIEGIGNAIITGDKLTVTIPGAQWISGGIYKNNLPYIISQSHKNDDDSNAQTITFLLKKRKVTRFGFRVNAIAGKYQLRLRYGGKSFSSYYNGYNDEFEILPKNSIPK